MIELRKEVQKMKRKFVVLITFCIIVILFYVNYPNEPKIISNITTLDTAYLTILVDKRELRNIKKLEEKLLNLCKEKQFEEINIYISVYTSQKDLKEGTQSMKLTYKKGD